MEVHMYGRHDFFGRLSVNMHVWLRAKDDSGGIQVLLTGNSI